MRMALSAVHSPILSQYPGLGMLVSTFLLGFFQLSFMYTSLSHPFEPASTVPCYNRLPNCFPFPKTVSNYLHPVPPTPCVMGAVRTAILHLVYTPPSVFPKLNCESPQPPPCGLGNHRVCWGLTQLWIYPVVQECLPLN